MIYNSAMELFRCTATFSPLEILNCIASTANRLNAACTKDARTL